MHEVVADEPSPELDDSTATQYRALVARCNYIAVDRAGAQYRVKELCRDMRVPTQASWARLQRLGRYVLGRPRAMIRFDWQPGATHIDIFTDANLAVCKTARKSTSGGVAMVGRCCIKSLVEDLEYHRPAFCGI